MNHGDHGGDGAGHRAGRGAGPAARADREADCAHASLLLQAYRHASVPVTVHVAIGTDTPHTHPAADAAAIGSADASRLPPVLPLVTALARRRRVPECRLGGGAARGVSEGGFRGAQSGHPLANFTTVNFDFLQHYRPRSMWSSGRTRSAGGKGYSHHRPSRDSCLPLLARGPDRV